MLLTLLHAILPPLAKPNKGKRITIKEAQEYLIILCGQSSNITDKIHEISKKKKPMQPFIILVGSNIQAIDDFYVYFDYIIYKLSTFLKSLEVCFKIFFVFNLHYPNEIQHIWFFIQKYFFEINNESDAIYPAVECLITDLNCQ